MKPRRCSPSRRTSSSGNASASRVRFATTAAARRPTPSRRCASRRPSCSPRTAPRAIGRRPPRPPRRPPSGSPRRSSASDTDAYRTALAELERPLDLLAEVALAQLSKGKPPTDAVSRRLRDLLRNAVADETARGELVRGVAPRGDRDGRLRRVRRSRSAHVARVAAAADGAAKTKARGREATRARARAARRAG